MFHGVFPFMSALDQQERKVFNAMAWMIIMVTVTIMPINIVYCIQKFTLYDPPFVVRRICLVLLHMNSLLNPVLYVFGQPAVKKMLQVWLRTNAPCLTCLVGPPEPERQKVFLKAAMAFTKKSALPDCETTTTLGMTTMSTVTNTSGMRGLEVSSSRDSIMSNREFWKDLRTTPRPPRSSSCDTDSSYERGPQRSNSWVLSSDELSRMSSHQGPAGSSVDPPDGTCVDLFVNPVAPASPSSQPREVLKLFVPEVGYVKRDSSSTVPGAQNNASLREVNARSAQSDSRRGSPGVVEVAKEPETPLRASLNVTGQRVSVGKKVRVSMDVPPSSVTSNPSSESKNLNTT
jgi:hypothetical protein